MLDVTHPAFPSLLWHSHVEDGPDTFSAGSLKCLGEGNPFSVSKKINKLGSSPQA